MAANNAVLTDENGQYDDWVELYNAGDAPVNIGGMFVTDDLAQPTKWQLPDNAPVTTTIPAGGFLLLWFDGEPSQGALHVDTKLGAGGEDIGLFANDGTTLLDGFSFGPQTANISYGRELDGGGGLVFFTAPTPGASNTSSISSDFAARPIASVPDKIFTAPFEVSLMSTTPGAFIRYTLDGSEPVANSLPYAGPIPIAQHTSLRARAFAPGYAPSSVATYTYLADVGHTFPIVALSFRAADFFDGATGIYPNFMEDWERPVHVAFFENDGLPGFSQSGAAKIHGTGSAHFAQKSLKIKAIADNGDGFFKHPIYTDLPFEEHKSFLLRNAGQDWNVTMFRDAFVTSLVGDRSDVGAIIEPPRLYLQAFRPGVAYLNGEYWGIHNLREHMKADYLAAHFGLREDEIDLLDNDNEASSGDFNRWNFLLQFLQANHFADDANLELLGTFLDLPHFLDYNVFNVLIDNADWPGNNYRRWRQRTNDAQWRFLSFDYDFSFGLLKLEPDTLLFNTGDASANSLLRALDSTSVTWPNPWWATLPFRKAMENEGFRRDFINRTADFLNVLFEPQRVTGRLAEFQALYEPEIQRHFDRWSPGWNPWADNLLKIKQFGEERPAFLRQQFVDYFNEISGVGTLHLQASPPQGGGISISTLHFAPENLPWSGQYFTGVNIPVQAVAAPGYLFSGWSSPALTAASGTINLGASATLVAYFEKGSTATDSIIINEINYHSPDGPFDSGDWVELFNPHGHTVDISGWVLGDEGGGYFNLPANTVMPAGGYLVVVGDDTAFSQVYPFTNNKIAAFGDGLHGFKLNNNGELIWLKNAGLLLMDSVRYDDEQPWPIGADGMGSSLQLVVWHANNALSQFWKANLPTPGLPNAAPYESQSIDFQPILPKYTTSLPFVLVATASSGLPVFFDVVSGPATISGQTVTLTGVEGIVTIRASQPGDNVWEPALPVLRSFHVSFAPYYCPAKADRPWLEWIERVQFGEIDHLSFKTAYGNFTDQTTPVILGQTLPLTVTPAFSWEVFEQYFRAWIDYNRDGDFEDAGELVMESVGAGPVGADVQIPDNAPIGETRLRIAMQRGQFPSPCQDFEWGEVEDYTVLLMNGDQNQGPPTTPDASAAKMFLFPNPVSSLLKAQFDTHETGPCGLSVVSTSGTTVLAERFYFNSGSHLVELDVSGLPDGTYWLVAAPKNQRALVGGFAKQQ